jgi:hypothetical protein
MGNVLFMVLHLAAVLFGLWALVITIPLHLLYAAVGDKEASAKRERSRAADDKSYEHRICPACAELVRRDARVCKHCSRELPPPPPVRAWWKP